MPEIPVHDAWLPDAPLQQERIGEWGVLLKKVVVTCGVINVHLAL